MLWLKRLLRSPGGQSLRQGSGQAMVEFALLMPILLVMLVGAVDFGRVFYATISVTNAAREGAYYASLNAGDGTTSTGVCTSPYTQLRAAVLNDLQTVSTSGSNPAVACISGNDGQTYSYSPSPSCSTIGVAPTCAGGTCSGGTCTKSFRYVQVTVTYTFNVIGPYGPFVPSYNIPRTTKMRVRP